MRDEKVVKQSSFQAVDRRTFLRQSALAIAGAALTDVVASPAACAQDVQGPFSQLEEATIAELQAEMAAGRLTSHRLVEMYIQRIDAIDKRGPAINTILEINPDALKIADELDQERKKKGPRGPLHGIPILLKDNIATADRMQTTAGSLALLGSRVPRDAFIASGLRRAGAVILGKTNLSEWADYRASFNYRGWSGRGGQGRNPYVLDRTPEGSS